MYVIVGANGYLGAYFIKNILEKTDEEITAVDLTEGRAGGARVRWIHCDITKPEDVAELNETVLRRSGENKIIFLAAYHHPDLVEKNPRLAWDVNVTSLSRFLNMADNVKRLVYPSTDSVYGEGGQERRFRETDELHPVNRYGVQKTVAEKLVTAYGYQVVRFPFLIAPSLVPGRKHFYDTLAESLLAGKPIEMFQDSYRSSLSFDTAAGLTVELAEREEAVPQIINVCGDKALSKYDVGLLLAEKLGVSRELVVPISVAGSQGIFEAKRAGSTVMDNALLKRTLGLSSVALEL